MSKNKKENAKRYRARKKKVIRDFYSKVGDECFVCGSKKVLSCHRKDLEKHEPLANLSMNQVKKENPEDYVRLCFRCHFGVHWCCEHLRLTWEEIVDYF